jgi:hypothetical protein
MAPPFNIDNPELINKFLAMSGLGKPSTSATGPQIVRSRLNPESVVSVLLQKDLVSFWDH